MPTAYKIQNLPLLSTAPGTTIEFPINDGGTTKKLTLDNLLTRVGPLATLTSPITNTSIVNAINYVYALTAGPSSKGFITNTNQTLAGDKTFNDAIINDGNQFMLKSSAGNFYTTVMAGAAGSSFNFILPVGLPGGTAFLTIDAAGQLAYTTSTVTSVATGAGLTGGPITSTGTISLAASGVVSGSYGSTVVIPQIIVDTYGRITSVTNSSIPTATGAVSGLLSPGDWTVFNNKLNTPTLTATYIPVWNTTNFTEYANFLVGETPLGARVVNVPNFKNDGIELSTNITTTAIDLTMEGSERVVLIAPSAAANIVITLPDDASVDVGTTFYFKVVNNDAATVKVQCVVPDEIEETGTTEVTLNVAYGYAAIIKASANMWQCLYRY